MGKSVYMGVGGVAKKVKSMYIGVGGVARKVKKAWIGVGGVAKLFWAGGSPELSTSSTFLSNYLLDVCQEASSFTIGNYAVFYEKYDYLGDTTSMGTCTLTAYNSSLTRSQPTSPGETDLAYRTTGNIGNYALVAGGRYYRDYEEESPDEYYYKNVYAYNSSLTQTVTNLANTGADMARGNIGSYLIFATGYTVYVSTMNASLTTTSLGTVSGVGSHLGSANSKYMIFGGGKINASGTYPSTVKTYNANLTLGSATDLTYPRYQSAVACVADHVVYVGGQKSWACAASDYYKSVEAFNSSLTKINVGDMSTVRGCILNSFVIIDDCMFIFGGVTRGSASYALDSITKIDSNLTITTLSTTMQSKRELTAVEKVGNNILIAGGYSSAKNSGSYYKDVEYFTIS